MPSFGLGLNCGQCFHWRLPANPTEFCLLVSFAGGFFGVIKGLILVRLHSRVCETFFHLLQLLPSGANGYKRQDTRLFHCWVSPLPSCQGHTTAVGAAFCGCQPRLFPSVQRVCKAEDRKIHCPADLLQFHPCWRQ